MGSPELRVTWIPVRAENRLANVRYGYGENNQSVFQKNLNLCLLRGDAIDRETRLR